LVIFISKMNNLDPKWIKWSKARTVDFLSHVKKFPCLWNPYDPNFRSTTQRTSAFEEISDQLKSPKKAVQIKLNYLIGCYAKETNRMINSFDDPNSRIDWYDEADFLSLAASKRANPSKVRQPQTFKVTTDIDFLI
jgi:hypothetical protein